MDIDPVTYPGGIRIYSFGEIAPCVLSKRLLGAGRCRSFCAHAGLSLRWFSRSCVQDLNLPGHRLQPPGQRYLSLPLETR
jgi:hypothetical protein